MPLSVLLRAREIEYHLKDSESIASDDPVVAAVLDLLQNREGQPWRGTASKLPVRAGARAGSQPSTTNASTARPKHR